MSSGHDPTELFDGIQDNEGLVFPDVSAENESKVLQQMKCHYILSCHWLLQHLFTVSSTLKL